MISVEDQRELVASIRDFVDAKVDQVPSGESVHEITVFLDSVARELKSLGVVGPEETGLWRCGYAMTAGVLSQLARLDAGLAFVLHRQALLSVVCEDREGWGVDSSVGSCWHGRYGIGRGGLRIWWQQPEQVPAELIDVFDARSARLVLIHEAQHQVLLPVWSPQGLYLYRVDVSRLPQVPHLGLCYLRAVQVVPEFGERLEPTLSARWSQQCWQQEWLALLSIQYGCLVQALERARAYSQIRKQGGCMIAAHPAVQQLLGEAEHALMTMCMFLDQTQETPAFEFSLLRQRPYLDAMIRKGLDACLQVLGGSGYMLDAGLARPWQDVHTLGQLSGGRLDMLALAAS